MERNKTPYLGISAAVPRDIRLAVSLAALMILLISGCSLIPNTETSADAAHAPTPTPTEIQLDRDELVGTANAYSTMIAGGNPAATVAAHNTAQAAEAERSQPTDTSAAAYKTPSPVLGERGVPIPADIPIPKGGVENLFNSPNLVSYTSIDDFSYLASYYESKMPNLDWTKVEAGSYGTVNAAHLIFEKSNRKVTISIQENLISQNVTVVITLRNK